MIPWQGIGLRAILHLNKTESWNHGIVYAWRDILKGWHDHLYH